MLSLTQSVEKLCVLLQDGISPSSIRGSCLIRFLQNDHDSLFIEITNSTVSIEKISCSHAPSSFVDVIDSAIIIRWGTFPHTITFRTPEIGNYFKVSGDLKFIQTLVNLVKRPPAVVEEEVSKIRNACLGYQVLYKNIVSCLGFSSAFVKLNLAKHVPVLCKGGLNDQKIMTYSKKEMLDVYGSSIAKFNIKTNQNIELRTFIESKSSCYSQGCFLPEYLDSICTFPFLTADPRPIVQLWSGYRSDEKPLTPLHMDTKHSFLAQVYGRKKVILYSPDQYRLLYPQKGMLYSQACFLDSHSPDYDLHPNFKLSSAIEVYLDPGDLFVIPAGWFHVVYSLEPVFSYSRFVDTDEKIFDR